MTKVLFDITHPAHVNFFYHLISRLKKKGISIDIVTLQRGRLVDILSKEYSTINYDVINKHRSNYFNLIFQTGISRIVSLFRNYLWKNYDVFIGVAAFQLAFLGKFNNTKSIVFYDDPEYKLNYLPSKLMADVFYLPQTCGVFGNNIFLVNCAKEWAYLSPKYFKPNLNALRKYGLSPYRYIFVREVSNKTMNYRKQKRRMIERVHEMDINYPVLFSLEDHSRKHLYHKWKLLQEPVFDIHSLMYFSKLIISDGDSMAREGALLGSRSIYCGSREMKINRELIQRGLLKKFNDDDELKKEVRLTIDNKESTETIRCRQDSIRNSLLNEWIDINKILFQEITGGMN